MSPIRPENRARYPKNWRQISLTIRADRAGWRCECAGECGRGTHEGRCPNRQGYPAYGTGSKVVLTVAHLDHTPENCDPDNLRAYCQACHLSYDAEHHRATAAATRRADLERQMEPLFDLPQDPSPCDMARTWPDRDPGRSTKAAFRPALAVRHTPSVRLADHSSSIDTRRLALALGGRAHGPCGTSARRSTLDCSGPSAWLARLTQSPRTGPHGEPFAPHASRRTSRASVAFRTLRHRRGRHHDPSWSGLGRRAALGGAGSSGLHRARNRPRFAPPDCRSQGRTWHPCYAMCQGCHLHYDRDHHAQTARATRDQQLRDAGQMELA